MDISTLIFETLKEYPILDILVVVSVIGVMSRIRKQFLDILLTNFKRKWIKFLILVSISFALATGLTALISIIDFNILNFIKSSIFNFIASYILYDVVRKIFLKDDDHD